MKPAAFDYFCPDSLEEALELCERYADDGKLLAGGQSLVPVMNFRLAQPGALIDLNRVTELDSLQSTPEGGLRIGAMTRQRTLERRAVVAERAPLLAEAIPFVAHPQIRNRGTLGGSLAHADPAAELPAVAVALGARFRLLRRGGDRWVDAADFFQGLFATALEPGELLAEVELPPTPPRSGSAFLEIARRHGDYAQVGVAASLEVDAAGRCAAAQLTYLSVGDVPIVARRAVAALLGETPGEAAFAAAAEIAATEEIEPSGDIHASAAFKRHLTRVLTARALRLAHSRVPT